MVCLPGSQSESRGRRNISGKTGGRVGRRSGRMKEIGRAMELAVRPGRPATTQDLIRLREPIALTVALHSTAAVQPALLIAGVATARALMAEHVCPAAIAGMSIGALCSKSDAESADREPGQRAAFHVRHEQGLRCTRWRRCSWARTAPW